MSLSWIWNMDVSRICPFFVISLSSNIKIRNCSIFWNLGDYFTEKTVYAIKLINVFLDTNYILASWVWRPCCLTPAIDEIHIIPEKYRQLDLTAWISVNDRKYGFHFRPKPNIWPEKYLALDRIPKPEPNVQIFVKIGGVLLQFDNRRPNI